MANNKSAKKRIKLNRRNNIQNNSYKSLMKSSEKKHSTLLKEYLAEKSGLDQSEINDFELKINESFNTVVSRIDRAAKKNVIHKNAANRKKRKLFSKTFFNKK